MKEGDFVWCNYNLNPKHKRVGDCTVRAISKALNQPWEDTYLGLVIEGYCLCDMPSANSVWGKYLKSNGFVREIIPTDCDDCYTVSDFCKEHPQGTFILSMSGHVVAVIDGNYFDTWDSGNEIPIYYWRKA